MTQLQNPRRGEVWLAYLDPTVGREQRGRRPILVVSADRFNTGRSDLIIALPITSRRRGLPWHTSIEPPEGGIDRPSEVMCDQVRSLAIERFLVRRGTVSAQTMRRVEDALSRLLGLG